MSKAKHNVISYSKVDLGRISFTDLESTERVPSQDIGYIRYDHPTNGERQFDIQTPEIKMDAGGIPDANGPYLTTEKARAYVRIPLEVNPNVKGETDEQRSARAAKLLKLRNTFESIDNHMVENKENYFGSKKKADKYTYQPIVRQAVEKDDSDDDDSDDGDAEVIKSWKPKYYMKAKIPLVWETDEVDLDVYRVNDEGTTDFESDGKWTKLEDIKTLDDLKKQVAYMRDVKFVLHFCKYWAQKQPSNGSSQRLYGVTLKVRRVEVKVLARTSNEDRSEDDGELFADSDSEDEVVQKFVANDKEEESDAESEDSESEEKVVVQKPVKKGRGKKSTA